MTAIDPTAAKREPQAPAPVPPGLEDVLRRAGAVPPPPPPRHHSPKAPPPAAAIGPAEAEPAASAIEPAEAEPAMTAAAPNPAPGEEAEDPEDATPSEKELHDAAVRFNDAAPAEAEPEADREAEKAAKPARPKPVAEEVSVGDGDVLLGAGTLALHAAIKAAVSRSTSPSFKVVALASGYAAEMLPLNFHEISRLQAQAVDPYAGRLKLLHTLHGRCSQFSCGPMKFQDWMKVTAQSDYDTLMYGLYAATYPGENEFDIGCRFCSHVNKALAQIRDLARVEDQSVYAEVKKMLSPDTDFRGAIQNSLVGLEVQRRLPVSRIVVAVRNPSIQDHMNGVQYFQSLVDKATGQLPPHLAGIETIRTIVLYTGRFLVPVAGGKFVAVQTPEQKQNLIGELGPEDGAALAAAIDAEVSRLGVAYKVPDFNCGACGKRNTDLFLNFESLLFTKMSELS